MIFSHPKKGGREENAYETNFTCSQLRVGLIPFLLAKSQSLRTIVVLAQKAAPQMDPSSDSLGPRKYLPITNCPPIYRSVSEVSGKSDAPAETQVLAFN
jgi:hypothetical protein